jgi:hypothetical protein
MALIIVLSQIDKTIMLHLSVLFVVIVLLQIVINYYEY